MRAAGLTVLSYYVEPDGSAIKHLDTDRMNDGSAVNNQPMSAVIMTGQNQSFPVAGYLGQRLGR